LWFAHVKLEYIGQLEGEIAAKAAEADVLRIKNEELMAENARLSDLTRMLLSSPAFSTFLSDMSGNGVVSTPSAAKKTHEPTGRAAPTSVTRKDVNPLQLISQQVDGRQDVAQIGMTMIPETTLDLGALDSSSNAWIEGNVDFGLYDAQVFTITELPQGPAVDQLDTGILSGKSTYSASSYIASDEPKQDLPFVERMPVVEEEKSVQESERGFDDVEIDESDPAFALFADSPPRTVPPPPCVDNALFGSIEPDKGFNRLELVVEEQGMGGGEISTSTMETFERLCFILEAASNRIAALIPQP
jgi:hypothetical protein